MKKIIRGAAIVGALFVCLTGCGSEIVEDKRALGQPGKKVFQVLVTERGIHGPQGVWITVTENQWDRCDLRETYRECLAEISDSGDGGR